MQRTDLLLHIAAQYLASFGKQYVAEQSDDSHTNVGWNSAAGAMNSRKTDDDQSLSLHVAELKLIWTNGDKEYPLGLEGRTHGEICVWLHHIALRCGLEEYDFYLHYTLDSGKIRPDFIFVDFDTARAKEIVQIRNEAQKVCEAFRDRNELNSEIRIWPHHFDTGGYASFLNSDLNLGWGLAIPDSMVDDYYFYLSAYKEGEAVETEGFPSLSKGEWKTEDFKGAILRLMNSNADDYTSFFDEALSNLSQ